MHTCVQCRRPFFLHERACPFCGAGTPAGRLASKAMCAVGGVVSAMVLMACYGGPPGDWDTSKDTDDPSQTDLDGDGVTADLDCDDSNAAVNPSAVEACEDTIDNDCDGLIDAADSDCTTR